MDPNAAMSADEKQEVTAVLKITADELLKHHPPKPCGQCRKPDPGAAAILLQPRIAMKVEEKLRQSDGALETVIFECECGFKRSEPLAITLAAQLKF